MLVDDVVSDAQTQGAATICSSIYAVRFRMDNWPSYVNEVVMI